MIETLLGHWLCLSIGAFFGFLVAAILAAGKHADLKETRYFVDQYDDLESITDITYKK